MRPFLFCSLGCAMFFVVAISIRPARSTPTTETRETTLDRSPVDLALSADERRLLVVNQTADTITYLDVDAGKVLAEVACNGRPTAVALAPDGGTALVSATFGGTVDVLGVTATGIESVGAIQVGFEPRGVAFAPDGKLAYVALTTAHAGAVIDVGQRKVVDRIVVKRWPRYLAVSPDGKRLAVGTSGDGGVSVVDLVTRKLQFAEEFAGLNLGQMTISRDNRHVYFPWIVYRHNPITTGNIRLGWVLASRLGRVRLDAPARREALSLDPQGQAVADPHGMALSPDEQTAVVAASGSQELLVYRLNDLPFQDYGGTDHIPPELLKDKLRFDRIALGGRPMAVRYSKDGRRVFVANYLLNAVQVVDVPARKIIQTIELGGPKEPSLARRGEAIFVDGKRSLDQWYSCHSCHYEGHTNSVTMDTKNDGRFGNFKTVLSLRNVAHTGPWFWHGYEKSLDSAVRRSMTDSMLGKPPTNDDVAAVIAYLKTLAPPPNPHREAKGRLSDSALRGEKIFHSAKADCARCHGGDFFTDGKIHTVGTNDRGDVYKGYNPPSLVGVYDRLLLLHDGRAKSLAEVLRGPHSPARVIGAEDLTPTEFEDLLAYLRSL